MTARPTEMERALHEITHKHFTDAHLVRDYLESVRCQVPGNVMAAAARLAQQEDRREALAALTAKRQAEIASGS